MNGKIPCFIPVTRTNVDGVEGSSVPGGLHVARCVPPACCSRLTPCTKAPAAARLSACLSAHRYGGGDEYVHVEPLLSVWCVGAEAAATSAWTVSMVALPECTVETLQLLHGFGLEQILPLGTAPSPSKLALEPLVQLVVACMPPAGPGGCNHVSLMLHGWLFRDFHASGRKAHQKFPLIAVTGRNFAMRGEAPQWLPVNGKFGYADQHVHKDEPVDLGGFTFEEVFFGSDMARVAQAEPSMSAAAWVTAVDVESSKAIVALCILLPEAVTTMLALRTRIASAKTLGDLKEALHAFAPAVCLAATEALDELDGTLQRTS